MIKSFSIQLVNYFQNNDGASQELRQTDSNIIKILST